jgi:hypothetical protein
MFTTVHGHFLAEHDIILLDHSLDPFTLESYITRNSMNSSLSSDLELMKYPPYPPEPVAAPERRKIRSNTSYFSAVRYEGPSNIARPLPPLYKTRSFPDFTSLYHECDFPGYAEATVSLLESANKQLAAWKKHMVNEGGFSLIRVRDPSTNKMVARRCVLLPEHALKHWGSEINPITKQWLDFSRHYFDRRALGRVRWSMEEMNKLFYFKRNGLDAPQRRNFQNVPVWKMEVMLNKWRTDKALEEWSANYQGSFKKNNLA